MTNCQFALNSQQRQIYHVDCCVPSLLKVSPLSKPHYAADTQSLLTSLDTDHDYVYIYTSWVHRHCLAYGCLN